MNITKIEKSFKTTSNHKNAYSTKGMVSTAFPEATKAGVEMLRKGGNAVDAACASAIALGVCEPQASGLGGQTLAILYLNGKTICIDGSTRAPSLAHVSRFRKKERRTIGYRATTVPSTPAVLGYINENFGRLDWSTIIKPAIRIARRGYKITTLQRKLQLENFEIFRKVESHSGARYFLKDGVKPYKEGDRFVQEDLAELLKHLESNGYKSFYHGKIPKLIDSDMKKNNGLLREDDLVMIPKITERLPIKNKYRSVTIESFPPPAAGRILILILMMLNNLPSKYIKQNSPQSYHYIAETFRKALMYRTQRPYEPNTYQQIQDSVFLNKNFSYNLSESIRDSIDPSLPLNKPPPENEDTTHLSVMDKEGNAVGITQSLESAYGSKAAAEGLGFLYNNYMSAFEYENQNYPHYLRPNTIPWTSVAPTLVFYKQKLWMVLGTPGSDRIPTVASQFLYSIIDGGLSIDQAMTKPRFHCSLNGTISLEAERFDNKVITHLEEIGYKIDSFEQFSFFHGAIHAVLKKQTGKGFQGTSDIRRDGISEGP